MKVWYANIPEETQYLKGKQSGIYPLLIYIIGITFAFFLLFGIVHLIKEVVPKIVRYIIIGDLFITTYFVWNHAAFLSGWNRSNIVSYFILVLFGFAIYGYSITEQPEKKHTSIQ